MAGSTRLTQALTIGNTIDGVDLPSGVYVIEVRDAWPERGRGFAVA